MRIGNCLVVQVSPAEGMISSLVRELKSYITQSQGKKKERKKERKKENEGFPVLFLRLSLERARETTEPKIG